MMLRNEGRRKKEEGRGKKVLLLTAIPGNL
jgi:hypothetical protein